MGSTTALIQPKDLAARLAAEAFGSYIQTLRAGLGLNQRMLVDRLNQQPKLGLSMHEKDVYEIEKAKRLPGQMIRVGLTAALQADPAQMDAVIGCAEVIMRDVDAATPADELLEAARSLGRAKAEERLRELREMEALKDAAMLATPEQRAAALQVINDLSTNPERLQELLNYGRSLRGLAASDVTKTS